MALHFVMVCFYLVNYPVNIYKRATIGPPVQHHRYTGGPMVAWYYVLAG